MSNTEFGHRLYISEEVEAAFHRPQHRHNSYFCFLTLKTDFRRSLFERIPCWTEMAGKYSNKASENVSCA